MVTDNGTGHRLDSLPHTWYEAIAKDKAGNARIIDRDCHSLPFRDEADLLLLSPRRGLRK